MITQEQEILISRYADPELTVSERAVLQTLLASAEGQALLSHYRALDAALESLPSNVESVDESVFRQAVNARLDATGRGSTRKRHFPFWKVLLPVAAAAAFALALLPQWLAPSGQPSGLERDKGGSLAQVEPPSGGGEVISVSVPRNEVVSTPQISIALASAPVPAVEPVVRVRLSSQQESVLPEVSEPDSEILCFASAQPVDQANGRSVYDLFF